MIKSCDAGSLPFEGNLEGFLEGANQYQFFPIGELSAYFEEKVVGAFIDKVKSGIDVPNYPQFRDMCEMFLSMIRGIEKVGDRYMETGDLSVNDGKSVLPEVAAIRQNLHKIYAETGEAVELRLCITGPYTLASLFHYQTGETLRKLGDVLSKILEANIFTAKHGKVSMVAIDEPVFGIVDDPLLDRGRDEREKLRKAWETMFQKATANNVQTCLHIHSTANQLFWEVEHLKIIESHVNDPIYEAETAKSLLEKTDKMLKASICVTDFDQLIRNSIVKSPRQKLNEYQLNEQIAETWKKIRNGKVDPNTLIEDVEVMKKRLLKTIRMFGSELVPYAGAECGLRGFPTYACAIECLKRTATAVKK